MTMGETRKSAMTRRVRPLEVRQAAARMVIAANTANGKATDPRIIAVAEGGQAAEARGGTQRSRD